MSGCDWAQFQEDLCLSLVDDKPWGFALETILFLYAFAGLALASDHLATAMETLCEHWSIPEDVGGATFMAIGSAIPEITVNAISTCQGVLKRNDKSTTVSPADLGVGAIIGSGLIAFLLIPAVCAWCGRKGRGLRLKVGPLARDMGTYFVALCVLVHCVRHGVTVNASWTLLAIYLAFILVLAFSKSVKKCFSKDVQPERTDSIFRENASQRLIEKQSGLSSFASEGGAEDEVVPDEGMSSLLSLLLTPIQVPIDATCPNCSLEEGDPKIERWYPVTFAVGFAWISVFSFVVTIVADRWVALVDDPSAMGLMGMVIVAGGAEIPDTVNAVAVARKGYGSMATSACIGSQIANICVGLGLPWTITAMAGFPPKVGHKDKFLRMAADTQLINVVLVALVLMGPPLLARSKKIVIQKHSAVFFFALYFSIVGTLTYMTMAGQLTSGNAAPPAPVHPSPVHV